MNPYHDCVCVCVISASFVNALYICTCLGMHVFVILVGCDVSDHVWLVHDYVSVCIGCRLAMFCVCR